MITTSTRPLRPPLTTHLLSVPVAEDIGTTREVLRRKGQQAAGATPAAPDVEPFVALQRWLAWAGERRVIIPFADPLADLIPATAALRMRRDFDQLVSCVKTIALLRQRQRRRARGDHRHARGLSPRASVARRELRGDRDGGRDARDPLTRRVEHWRAGARSPLRPAAVRCTQVCVAACPSVLLAPGRRASYEG